jgi:hypothetical protein
MRRFLRANGLTVVLALLFLTCLSGQSLTGHRVYNEEQHEHGRAPIGLGEYLATPHFTEHMLENWESEFLEMGFFVILTVFLFQKGSAESKSPDEPEDVDEDPRKHRRSTKAPGPVRRGGWALLLYEHSLSLAFLMLFAVSFGLHLAMSTRLENEDRARHVQPPVSAAEQLASASFWFESFQNWQSEFLGVGTIVVLSIFLRERGSPESKPVATPHDENG